MTNPRSTRSGNRSAIIAGVMVAGCLGIAIYPNTLQQSSSESVSRRVVNHPTDSRGIASKCGNVTTVVNPSSEHRVVTDLPDGSTLPYDSNIPSAGWFFTGDVYGHGAKVSPEQTIEFLAEGGTVIWYPQDTPNSVVNDLIRTADDSIDGAVVLQWPQDREYTLAQGRYAVATYGATQICSQIDPIVVADLQEWSRELALDA